MNFQSILNDQSKMELCCHSLSFWEAYKAATLISIVTRFSLSIMIRNLELMCGLVIIRYDVG